MATSFTQTDFRFRFDDGAENSATWKAAVNTNIPVDLSAGNVRLRLRLAIQETGTTPATFEANLAYDKNSAGAWTAVQAASSNVKAVDSSHLTDNENTTQQITAFSFVAGRVDDVSGLTGATDSIPQNSGTEFEFMVELVAADLANGDTLDFRVYRHFVQIQAFTHTPRITIAPIDTSVTFDMIIPVDDYGLIAAEDQFEMIAGVDDISIIVPEEQTEYTTWYGSVYLTDHSGNRLTDHNGALLVITQPSIEEVYVLNVPPDDLSLNVAEET
jgi:hypothetical protein